jgi:hypothetical protein
MFLLLVVYTLRAGTGVALTFVNSGSYSTKRVMLQRTHRPSMPSLADIEPRRPACVSFVCPSGHFRVHKPA